MQREHLFQCGGELPARFHLSLLDRGFHPVKGTEDDGVLRPALAQVPVTQCFQKSFLMAQAGLDSGNQVIESAREIVIRFGLDFPDAVTKGLVDVPKDGAVGTPGGFPRR
jgi:hypothetical protein